MFCELSNDNLAAFRKGGPQRLDIFGLGPDQVNGGIGRARETFGSQELQNV